MASRQGSISGSPIGSSDSELITGWKDECGSLQGPWRASARSPDESLVGRIGPGPCGKGAGVEHQRCSGSTAKTPRLRSSGLTLETWMDMSPARTMARLDFSLTVAGAAGAEYCATSGFPEV